ncbi:MAG: InlB B-repeat-containing protein, partial [Butyrivibrio sp.]|nr:InlB B-repeat-containing protein [Butyrivibrio sp.]
MIHKKFLSLLMAAVLSVSSIQMGSVASFAADESALLTSAADEEAAEETSEETLSEEEEEGEEEAEAEAEAVSEDETDETVDELSEAEDGEEAPVLEPEDETLADTYTRGVTLDANGGTFEGGEEKVEIYDISGYRSNVVSKFKPVRDGYMFMGWFREKDCKNCVSSTQDIFSFDYQNGSALERDKCVVDPGTTVYAGWSRYKTLKLIYATGDGYDNGGGYLKDDDGDKISKTFLVPDGKSLETLHASYKGKYKDVVANMSRYSFCGFYLDRARAQYAGQADYDYDNDIDNSIGTVVLSEAYSEENEITLYAGYKEDSVLVDFHLGDEGYCNYDENDELKPDERFHEYTLKNQVDDLRGGYWISFSGWYASRFKHNDPTMKIEGFYYDRSFSSQEKIVFGQDGTARIQDEKITDGEVDIYVKWTRDNEVAKVTFDLNGGAYCKDEIDAPLTSDAITTSARYCDSDYDEGTARYEKYYVQWKDLELSMPVNEDRHYRFTGWYYSDGKKASSSDVTDDICDAYIDPSKVVNGEITLKAGWSKDYLTGTLELGNTADYVLDHSTYEYTFVDSNTLVCSVDKTYGFESLVYFEEGTGYVSRSGKQRFDGWKTKDGKQYDGSVPKKDIILYAKLVKSITVTFDYGDEICYDDFTGYEYSSREVSFDKDQKVNLEDQNLIGTGAISTKNARYVENFYYDPAFKNPVQKSFLASRDMTLYAKWVDFCGVKLDLNGGTYKGNSDWTYARLKKGESLKDHILDSLEDITPDKRDGYEFCGWYEEASCENKVDLKELETRKLDSLVTIYACWKETVHIYFYPNYSFGDEAYRYRIVYSCNGEWEKEKIDEYSDKVILNVAGGEAIGNKYPVPSVLATSVDDTSDLHFTGWYSEPECLHLVSFDEHVTATEGLSFYAGWSTDNYEITFVNEHDGQHIGDMDCGQASITYYVPKGTALKTIPKVVADPSKSPESILPTGAWTTNEDGTGQEWHIYEDHYFYIDEEGNIHSFNSSFIPTRNMTLYAKWGETVTVTADLKGIDCSDISFDFISETLGFYNNWKFDSTYKKMTMKLPKGARWADLWFPEYKGDLRKNFGFQNKYSKKYGGVKIDYKDSNCTTEYSPYDVIGEETVVYAKWLPLRANENSFVEIYYGDGKVSTDGKYIKKFVPGAGDDENTRIALDIPRNDKGWEFSGLYYYSDKDKDGDGIADPDLSKPYEYLYYISGKPYIGWTPDCITKGKISEVRLCAVYKENVKVTIDAGQRAHFKEKSGSGNTSGWTGKVDVLVAPGRYIVLSDYFKDIVEPENRVFAGWHYYVNDYSAPRLATVKEENGTEYIKVTGDMDIFATWEIKGENEVTGISVTDSEGNDVSGGITLDPGQSVKLKSELTGTVVLGMSDAVKWYIADTTVTNPENMEPIQLLDDGTVIARAQGEARVYAEVMGVCSDPVKITVSNKEVASKIEVSVENATAGEDGAYSANKGDALTAKAVIFPQWYENTLVWKSSDEDICSVSGFGTDVRLIGGSKEGQATITVSSSKVKAPATIKVNNIVPVAFNIHEARVSAITGSEISFTSAVNASFKDSLVYKVYDNQGEVVDEDAAEVAPEDFFSLTKNAESGKMVLTFLKDDIDRETTFVIKAIVSKGGKEYTDSISVSVIPLEKVEMPTSDPYDEGKIQVRRGQRVRLFTKTPGAKIYYIINDADTDENSEFDINGYKAALYTDAFEIKKDSQITAIAVKEGFKDSDAAGFDFEVIDGWGEIDKDAEPYLSAFGRDLAKVPTGIWYVIGDDNTDGINDATIYLTSGAATDYVKTYTGSKITFGSDIKVFMGTTRLIESRDYTLSYGNNTNVSAKDAVNPKNKKSIAPFVTIKGKGNYTKTATFKFAITPTDVNEIAIASETVVPVAIGPKVKLSGIKPSLTYKGRKLTLNKDYVLSYFRIDPENNVVAIDGNSTVLNEAGKTYEIVIHGKEKSNFTTDAKDEKIIVKTINGKDKSIVSVSKLKYGNIKNKAIQTVYDETAVTAEKLFDNTEGKTPLGYVYVKSASKDALTYGTDFTVTLTDKDNTSAGKHGFIIEGKGDKFIGTKKGFYTITEKKGENWKSVKVAGLSTKVEYTGHKITLEDLFKADTVITAQNKTETDDAKKWNSVTLYRTKTTKVGSKKVTEYIKLEEGKDYSVSMDNNGVLGKFSLVFTGKGGYSGSIKKTVTVKAYGINESKKSDKRIHISCSDAVYKKTGAVPGVTVVYMEPGDFEGTALREGIDYTLTYKNNKQIVSDYESIKKASARPTVIIKGKGNYAGTCAAQYFNIEKAELSKVTISAADVTYNAKGKAGYFLSAPKFTDGTGLLTVGKGKDLKAVSKNDICYYYVNDTQLLDKDGTIRAAGDEVLKTDKVPAGCEIRVVATITANDKSPYDGENVEVSGTY